jgi:TrmH family RNA methyltransferase
MNPVLLSSNRQKFLRKLYQKKYRYQNKLYLCEGYKLLETAAAQKTKAVREIIVTESLLEGKYGKNVKIMAADLGIQIYFCEQKTMDKLSDEESPANLLFIVKMNLLERFSLKNCNTNNIVCLENICDPGNLGTIIRTAIWFGINTLILGPNCVDPYNPKAVRASAGAIFQAQLFTGIDLYSLIKTARIKGYHTIATVLKNGINLNNWKKTDKNIIFFGSESSGISNRLLQHIESRITIPGVNQMESLNVSVAAGIILFYLLHSSIVPQSTVE